MTEQLHFHFLLSCIGERNGNLLQCSCLENPRDWGAWWAAVYGVTQSWTRLKWLSSSSSSSSRQLLALHLWSSVGPQDQDRGQSLTPPRVFPWIFSSVQIPEKQYDWKARGYSHKQESISYPTALSSLATDTTSCSERIRGCQAIWGLKKSSGYEGPPPHFQVPINVQTMRLEVEESEAPSSPSLSLSRLPHPRPHGGG